MPHAHHLLGGHQRHHGGSPNLREVERKGIRIKKAEVRKLWRPDDKDTSVYDIIDVNLLAQELEVFEALQAILPGKRVEGVMSMFL